MYNIIPKLTESQVFLNVANNASATATYTLPDGMGRVCGLLFNPLAAGALRIQIRGQNSKMVMLDNFSTLIGDRGYLALDYESGNNEKFIVQITNVSGAQISPVVTLLYA